MSGRSARGKVIPQFLWCNTVNLFGKLCTFRHPRNSGSSPLPSSIRCSASSPLRTAKGMTRGEGRRETRRPWKFEVLLSSGGQPMLAERASTENVSSRGVRVRTERLWKPDARVFVKSSRGDLWARARVVYCRTLRSTTHALGLEFFATAYRYNLTFRCIKCGSYEASANFRSDRIEFEDQIKARIYPVRCAGCGWKGEACGFSVTRILRYKSRETYNPDDKVAQLWPICANTF